MLLQAQPDAHSKAQCDLPNQSDQKLMLILLETHRYEITAHGDDQKTNRENRTNISRLE